MMISEALKSTIEDLSRRSIKLVPQYLYHYTNADAFMGICKGREFWLGDVRFMNDPSELAFGEGVARKALDRLGTGAGAEETRALVEDALGGLASGEFAKPTVFAFSLCRSGDALGHWRQYADQGRGYCLAFRSRDLLRLTDTTLGLFRIRYTDTDQQEVFLYFYDTIAKLISSGIDLSRRRIHLNQVAVGLAIISAVMKNRSYESESEWRLLSIIPQSRHEDINYMARRSSIKPYIIHKFDELYEHDEGEAIDPMAEITVGPALEPIVVDSVKMFLRSTSFKDVPVRRSEIPVRDVI